jgi:hypothetical protein
MRRVKVNGVEIVVGTPNDAKENYPSIVLGKDSVPLADGSLHIFTFLSSDEWVQLLGVRQLGAFDWAKPQDWYSAQTKARGLEAVERDQFVWLYPHDRNDPYHHTGRPCSLRNLRDDWLYRVICRTLAGLPIYRDDKLNCLPDMRQQWFHIATVGLMPGLVDMMRADVQEARQATEQEEADAHKT